MDFITDTDVLKDQPDALVLKERANVFKDRCF
jgi:hypothetical protein